MVGRAAQMLTRTQNREPADRNRGLRRLTRAIAILQGANAMSSITLPLPQLVGRLYASATQQIDRLQPLAALALRVYVARVFFLSGLTKIHDWNVTLALFQNEYHVPVLSPAVAAALGTCAELGLPILLLLGFGSRFTAAALFVFNIVAAISYPDLSDAGLKD